MSVWNNSNCLTMLLNYIQFIWSQINTPYFLLVLFSRAWVWVFKWLLSLVQNRICSHCYKWILFSWRNTFSKASDKMKERKKKGKKKKPEGSCMHIACHPPKKVSSLKIIQAHTSIWIFHYYPKLFFSVSFFRETEVHYCLRQPRIRWLREFSCSV